MVLYAKDMRLLILLVSLLISFQTAGQTTFWASPSVQGQNLNVRLPRVFTDMVWQIQDHTIKWGDSISVKSKANVDTIFFSRNKGLSWDTLLCKIPATGQYSFVPNLCCGSFNVVLGTTTTNGAIHLKNKSDNMIVAGLGSTGNVIVPGEERTLGNPCRSALSTNIRHITIHSTVKGHKNTSILADRYQCVDPTIYEHYNFSKLEMLSGFKWIFLEEKILNVVLNPNNSVTLH